MGLGIKPSSSSGEGPSSRTVLPITTPATIIQELGSPASYAASVRMDMARQNRASRTASPASAQSGFPTILADRATFTYASRLVFPVAEPASFTILFAFRATASDMTANAARFGIGGWGNGTDGAEVYIGGSTLLRTSATIGGVKVLGPSLTYATGEMMTPRYGAFVTSAGVGMYLYDLTKNTQTADVSAAAIADRSTLAARGATAGRGYASGGTQAALGGTFELIDKIVFPAALSKADIDTVVAARRRFLSEVRGVTA